MNNYDVIRRPLVTEKGVDKKDNERTLCFEVNADANKTQVKAAVEKLFKVKVSEVRTATFTLKSFSTACFTCVLLASADTSKTSVASLSFLSTPFSVTSGRRIT